MTKEELIVHLDKIEGNPVVGVIGHFGEFYEMDEHDFYLRTAYDDSGVVLHISSPDIGPEPD